MKCHGCKGEIVSGNAFAIAGKVFCTRKCAYSWLIVHCYEYALDYDLNVEEDTDEELTEQLLDIMGEAIYVKDGVVL